MRIINVCIVLLLSCFAGCGDSASNSDNRFYVVTTTGMIADIVENIGGEHVRVESLMGPGVDPHVYQVTASDTRKLARAHLIFYNGLHLEGKMTDILAKLSRKKPVFAVVTSIDEKKLRKASKESKTHDPHIWFDVSLWKEAAIEVEKRLIAKDAKHAEHYRKKGKAYRAKLDELHEWVMKEIQSIPVESRILVTAHDAFGYFGAAYKIEVRGLQGISTAADYGIKDVENLAALLVKKKIKAVFVESSVPQKSIHAVIENCRKQNHSVKIGGSLYSDAMGAEGTNEDNYIGMVKYNVRTIVSALK